ncbi:uncharacterized protein LY89DRAFT_725857 [Mollisia scopiformis]|uniref:Uncharacterized protein n=1 Tax=Mollisia scopiformis TaxID=149040 RepID=A0A132B6Q7_MOLSC|nr:uncharacterized protein LY89DRAFT_725857 [Mollisia scopiformis]KUJ07357.1 hypothetical protein LY89DRAFT_725857 [Mollisia scopiformis]
MPESKDSDLVDGGGLCPPGTSSARNDGLSTQNSDDCDSGEGYHPSSINSNLDRKDSRSYHRSSINSDNDNNSILPQYPPPVYEMSLIPLLPLFRRTPAATPATTTVAAGPPAAAVAANLLAPTIADLHEIVVANLPTNQPTTTLQPAASQRNAHQQDAHQAGVTIYGSRGCCSSNINIGATTFAVIITCIAGVMGPVIYFLTRK